MTNGAEEDDNAAVGEPPTEPTEAARETEPTEEARASTPPPPPTEGGAPTAPPGGRGGWLIPKWAVAALVGLVVVALLFGGAFALGRATASSGDNENARNERPFEGRSPRDPGEGPNLPRVPRQVSGVFLGVATQASTDPQGVRVVDVVGGSPAESAGLQADDVITAVDGTAVSRPAELAQQIRSHQSGDQVTIAYSRGGNTAETQVTLADRSSDNQPNS